MTDENRALVPANVKSAPRLGSPTSGYGEMVVVVAVVVVEEVL